VPLYCYEKFFAGGQAKVLRGIVFGMGSLVMKGSSSTSSKVGLFDGSKIKILLIKFLAFSEIVI